MKELFIIESQEGKVKTLTLPADKYGGITIKGMQAASNAVNGSLQTIVNVRHALMDSKISEYILKNAL